MCVVWHTDFIWLKSEAAARSGAVHFVLTTPLLQTLLLWMVCDRILDLQVVVVDDGDM